MISIYKPFIKLASVVILIIVGMAFSVSSVSKQSQQALKSPSVVKENIDYQAKSKLARKLQRGVNMVTPGNKQFSPRYLNYLLKTTKVK